MKKSKEKNKNTYGRGIRIIFACKFPKYVPKMQGFLKVFCLFVVYLLSDPPETHSVMKTTSFFLEFTQAVMKFIIFG